MTQVLLVTTKWIRDHAIEIAEVVLATLIFCAVLYFSWKGMWVFQSKDWSQTVVMYEFISFVLVVLLGLEVARLILVRSIGVVMELMMLIVARKMLIPDIQALELVYCAIAFAIIVGVYYVHELKPLKSLENLTT